MLNNKNFYPTTKKLIREMWDKVPHLHNTKFRMLDPEAGKGDILEFIQEKTTYSGSVKLSAIEIDENLQHILTGKKFKLIDSDFLNYSGNDKFDLIMMNPPFDDGDKHLMKAIDIMYSGDIVCLLNAETLKNPYTNLRKELVKRLEELNADIEYIQDSFVDAERKTGVEIALVYINIERNYEDDLFQESTDKAKNPDIELEEKSEVAASNNIEALVEEYNATVLEGMAAIKGYFENPRIWPFFKFTLEEYGYDKTNDRVYECINVFMEKVRADYWSKVLDLKDVKGRMTEKKLAEFHNTVQTQQEMEFTEYNIRAFILKLVGNYEDILTEAVADIFDKMTEKHHWSDETSKNTHYFNGWKTNKAFYCNYKVIIPMDRGHFCGFRGYSGWEIQYNTKRQLDDIDLVMSYFSEDRNYLSIVDALEVAFRDGKTRGIESTFFNISVYKKGTIHLTFRDEAIRRRFNVTACKHKKWLQDDYGRKDYNSMSGEEKAVVDDFEGKENYEKNINQLGFAKKEMLQIA